VFDTGTPTGIDDDLVLRIDGSRPLSAASVKALETVCDKAEDHGGPGIVTVHVWGAPGGPWTRDLNVALVTKWERVLRRLERLVMTTVAVASGDCGGAALDALLVTDLRVAAEDVRLVVPVDGEATWPGMAMYRLSQQAGAARVRRAVLFGIPIEASEALALHLVDELVEDPASALAAMAEMVGAFSGRELAIRRQLMFDATTTSFEDALGSHLAACDRALRRASAEAAS
jgi:isomerase DpgB